MASFDSDSSDGGDDFTETSVLLGYASKEAADDTSSYIGGHPTWLDSSSLPAADLAKCKVCNSLLVLLLQLNGDLPEVFPNHERRIYILSCRRKACRRKPGSIRAFRCSKISQLASADGRETAKEETPTDNTLSLQPVGPSQDLEMSNIGNHLFGARPREGPSQINPFSSTSSRPNPNPFSSVSASTDATIFSPKPEDSSESKAPPRSSPPSPGLSKSFASVLAISASQENAEKVVQEDWPDVSKFPPAYPLYFLVDADYETLDKEAENAPVPTPSVDFGDGTSTSSSQREEKDAYESTLDAAFQKFADRLSQNPEQVIRYEFRGSPLLYSKSDQTGRLFVHSDPASSRITTTSGSLSRIPKCSNCGAKRVFEVQLTPHAITELEAEEDSLDGMDWGTIIVGVCERDCVPSTSKNGIGFVEEWTGVQWEELGRQGAK